ncbi:MAG TPA: DMT family transporter [Frankiaceae bacterium]|nr:DMT family transporter [Frankiaceae bacterium]
MKLAIGAALGSALCFALASVLQQRAAARVPTDTSLRMVHNLIHRPIWLAGLVTAAATLVLQFVALANGELALIQPLMLLGLLFALPISVLLEKCQPSPREWWWAAVLVAGLTLFLLSAHPSAGPLLPDDRWMFALGGGGMALIGALVLLGWGPARRHRAALFGLGTGIAYGLSAALMKYCYGLATESPSRLLTSWPGYALLVVGGGGILLNQLAYRSGPLAGALPPLAIADPVVATICGVAAFSETLRTSALAVTGQILGFVIVTAAIVRLASYAAGRDAQDPHVSAGTTPHQRRDAAAAAS